MELLQRDPQRRSAPFAPMPCKFKSKLQPLTRQFFSNLIKLESDLQHQDYTMETLDELTSHYATAVEYYGALKDEIASYFVFKIQDSLAKKKSLKMLMEQSLTKSQERESPAHNSKTNSKQDKKILFSSLKVKDETIKENVKEESEEEEQGEEPDVQKQRRERPEYRRMRISISRMNNRNQKCVMLFQKVETEKKNEEQNFNKTLDSFKDVSQNNDGVIMDGIKIQKDRIRQKIEQRKQNSFATYSMGNSLGTINKTLLNLSFNVPERRDHSRLDYVLGELDNYDEYDYNEDFSAGIKGKQGRDFEKSPKMKYNKQKSFPSNEDEENPLDNEFGDFSSNQVLQPIENLVPKQKQDNNKSPQDLFSYSEEDVCFQKKSRVNVLKSSAKRSNKENAPRYVD